MKQWTNYVTLLLIVGTVTFTGCGSVGTPQTPPATGSAPTKTDALDLSEQANDEDTTGAAEPLSDSSENESTEMVAGKTFENDFYSFTAPKDWVTAPEVFTDDSTLCITKSLNKAIAVTALQNMFNPELSLKEYASFIEGNIKNQQQFPFDIKINEIRENKNGKFIYMEASTVVTEEFIQYSLDSGFLTQEAIDEIGGMAKYVENTNVDYVYAISHDDNNLYMIVGSIQGGNSCDIADETLFVNEQLTLK